MSTKLFKTQFPLNHSLIFYYVDKNQKVCGGSCNLANLENNILPHKIEEQSTYEERIKHFNEKAVDLILKEIKKLI